MSKMREAFVKKYKIPWHDADTYLQDAFKSGYHAAIAEVRKGGAKGYFDKAHGDYSRVGRVGWAPLFTLPEDV